MTIPSVITIAAYVFAVTLWTVAVTAYYTRQPPQEDRPER
jgi:hypothetical protein